MASRVRTPYSAKSDGSLWDLRRRFWGCSRILKSFPTVPLGVVLYLLYVDESGKPHGIGDRYFVLGGVALHEEDCYPFAKSLDRLQRRQLSAQHATLELHASRMWAGRHEWARVAERDRRRLLRAILRHLETWTAPSGRVPRFFAVAIDKQSFPTRTLERAHEELFARFDELLTRLHRGGESHRSLVVADESSWEHLVRSWIPRWKTAGTRMGRLHSFAEVPLYVDSKDSRLIQIADFVAWATWHYYEHNVLEHIQRLNARFDGDGRVQHGLAHLIRGYRTCICVPCASRRTRIIASTIPPL